MSTITDKRPVAQAVAGLRGRSTTTAEFHSWSPSRTGWPSDFSGSRDTCILTSFALHDVLQRLGYSSRPLRIEAAVFPDDRKLYGTILGSLNGCGVLQRPACGEAISRRWSTTNGCSIPRSTRRTRRNGHDRCASVARIRISEKFKSEHGSILARWTSAACGFLHIHGK